MDRIVKGLLGTKLGMTQVFDDNNRMIPVNGMLRSTVNERRIA